MTQQGGRKAMESGEVNANLWLIQMVVSERIISKWDATLFGVRSETPKCGGNTGGRGAFS